MTTQPIGNPTQPNTGALRGTFNTGIAGVQNALNNLASTMGAGFDALDAEIAAWTNFVATAAMNNGLTAAQLQALMGVQTVVNNTAAQATADPAQRAGLLATLQGLLGRAPGAAAQPPAPAQPVAPVAAAPGDVAGTDFFAPAQGQPAVGRNTTPWAIRVEEGINDTRNRVGAIERFLGRRPNGTFAFAGATGGPNWGLGGIVGLVLALLTMVMATTLGHADVLQALMASGAVGFGFGGITALLVHQTNNR